MPRATVVAVVMVFAVPAMGAGDYATAPFEVQDHPYTFGQAPVFLPNGQQVLFGKDFRQGDKNQVYIANFDGSDLRCLTCTGRARRTTTSMAFRRFVRRATGSCSTPGAGISRRSARPGMVGSARRCG